MRIAVRIFSALGFVGYFIFLMLLGAASGLSDVSSPVNRRTLVLLASPLVYFGYCLLSTFGHWRKVPLLITGIAAHLCVVPFVVCLISDGSWIFVFPVAVMAFCWTSMFFELAKANHA